jgi:GT2 family glycosyltransferase
MQETDRPEMTDAIRWLPPVRISGETHYALFAVPRASITYELQPPAGSRILVDCGLLPAAWAGHRGGVEFEAEVEVPERHWTARRSVRLDPGLKRIDRRWRRLSIALPPGSPSPTTLRLRTRLPDGADSHRAWSIWGEPRIEWRKSREERRRTIAGLISRVRQVGLVGTLRLLKDLQSSDERAIQYRRWVQLNTPSDDTLARFAAEVETFTMRPRISVITPVYNTDPRWLRACIESVRSQVYPHWELCLADDGSTSVDTTRVLREYANDARIRIVRLPVNAGISAASNAALDMATGEFVAMLDHDDELTPEALFSMVRFLNTVPDADFIYSDEDKLDGAGQRCDPYFKPDWSPEHFQSCMYTCHLMMLRTSLVRELGGFRRGVEGSQDYDLALRVMEKTSRIHHVPEILYHWRKIEGSVATSGQAKAWAIDAGERALEDHVQRTGVDAVVLPGAAPGLYRIRHRIAGKPLVSIVIPTDGRSRDVSGRPVDLLSNCVRSIVEKTTYENYELVIADNGRLSDSAVALLDSIPHCRVHFQIAGQFNYARKLNFAVGHSRGQHLLLFNDDIEVITPEWIEAMLEYSQQESIGAVGARLLYPDGRLQHIGVVMGVCGLAAHAFHSHPGGAPGYGFSALIVRNYSAVTAACMLTRRELYERLGGFDERFAFDFNDTDYCLRLRREGYRIVYTPYAELYHLESATFGTRTWNGPDLAAMRERWSDLCERDPYYNPHLTRDFPDYRVRV